MKKWHKVLIIAAAAVVVIAIAGIVLWNYLFGGLKHVQLDTSELGIEETDENGLYSWYNAGSQGSEMSDQSEAVQGSSVSDKKIASAADNTFTMNNTGNDQADDASGNDASKKNAALDEANTNLTEDTQDNTPTAGEADKSNGSNAENAQDNTTTAGGADESYADETQNTVSKTDSSDESAASEQSSEAAADSQNTQKHAIINIAIFGMSISQVGGIDTDRSDMNLIVSIDQDNNRVCLTSVLRDSKVPIEGHDPQKINAAYKYGGATLAIKTLNQNFHLNIANYITVNFESLLEIVDYFGGVEIELTEDEAAYIGGGLTAGKHLLDGETALEYASIRYIDSDYYRASRQQTVILALLQKVAALPKTSYPEAVNKLMGTLESSMTVSELLSLIDCIDISTVQLVTNTIPDKNYETDLWGGIDSTGSWVYEYDIEEAAKRIHRIIYGGSEHGEEETTAAVVE